MNVPRITEEIADLSYAIAQLVALDIPPRLGCRDKIIDIIEVLTTKLETRVKQI